MALPLIPMAIAAAGGWGASKLKGKEGGIEKTSTMTPEQEKLLKQVYGFTSERVGKGLPAYEGERVAPMTPYEEAGMGRLGEYIGEGLPETTQYGLGKYREAMKGMEPEETFDWYQKYIAPEEKRILTEELIPTFKESMVPGGALRSTGTERGIADIVSKYGTTQMGRIGEAIMSERAGARQMIGMLPQMYGVEAEHPLRQAEAATRIGALPRLIEQEELTAKFEEFKRTTPELSPVLDLAMQIMNVGTQAAYYRPYQPSNVEQLMPAIGKGVGTYLGAKGATKEATKEDED